MEEVERFAETTAVDSLYLSTTPFLDATIRLYQGCGFRFTEEGPSDLFGTPLRTMEKKLSE